MLFTVLLVLFVCDVVFFSFFFYCCFIGYIGKHFYAQKQILNKRDGHFAFSETMDTLHLGIKELGIDRDVSGGGTPPSLTIGP